MQGLLRTLLSRTTLICCASLALLSACACAQVSSDTTSLTLKGAVQLALKQNIDLQVSNLDEALTQQDSHGTRAALLPQASFRATEEIERYNLEALIGLQFAGISKNVGPFQSIHAGVRFSSPVFDLSLIRRYQASGHQVQASRDDIASTREQTVLLTVSQYLACLRAQAEVRAADSRVELAQSLEKQAEALFADGVATRIDVSRAKVRLLNEQQSLVDAHRDTETTLYALRRILNLQDAATPRLLDTDLFSLTPALEIADPLQTALMLRPELHALSNRILAAQSERKAALAESLPTLNVSGFWNQQGRTLGNIFPGYEYQATLNVPLFTGGRLRADRASARYREQRRTAQLQDARNRVTEQVTTDEQELKSALSDVELGRQQVALAHDEVTLAQGRFSAGVTDNIEVTTAQDELAHANDLEIAAHYRYNVARANLARAAGSIETTYLHP